MPSQGIEAFCDSLPCFVCARARCLIDPRCAARPPLPLSPLRTEWGVEFDVWHVLPHKMRSSPVRQHPSSFCSWPRTHRKLLLRAAPAAAIHLHAGPCNLCEGEHAVQQHGRTNRSVEGVRCRRPCCNTPTFLPHSRPQRNHHPCRR